MLVRVSSESCSSDLSAMFAKIPRAVRIAQLDSAGFRSGKRRLGPSRDHGSFLLGERGVDMEE